MKTNLLMTFLVLITMWVAFISNVGEPASIPDFGACGAPGDPETTCATCHNTSDEIEVNIELVLESFSGVPITRYVAGETYVASVTIAVLEGQPAGYGFQTIALKAALNEIGEDVDGFSSPADNVQIATASHNRKYAEHNDVSRDSVFRFDWTAPIDADGYVTFYACGNGVNWDGTNEGDNTACTRVEFREQPVSINDLRDAVQLSVSPNPVSGWLNLSISSKEAMTAAATIFTTEGRRVQTFPLELAASTHTQQLQVDVNGLPPGLYVLRLSDGHRVMAVRFVKE